MLRKKLLLLLLLVTLLVSVSTTDNARACSGDLCNCGVDMLICDENCDLWPPASQMQCHVACARANVRCAKACCDPWGGDGPPAV